MTQNELTGGRRGIQALSNRSRGSELEAGTYLASQFTRIMHTSLLEVASSAEKSRNLNLQYCDQHLFLSLSVYAGTFLWRKALTACIGQTLP